MLGSLEEFRYLTVPNASLYRAAMRFFFEQYLNQRSTLPPEDVQEVLKQQIPEYTFEETLLFLDQLVEWGNLVQPQRSYLDRRGRRSQPK